MVAEDESSFFADPKRIIQTSVAVVLLFVAIYVLVPKLFDLQDAIAKIKEGIPSGSPSGSASASRCSRGTSLCSAVWSARR